MAPECFCLVRLKMPLLTWIYSTVSFTFLALKLTHCMVFVSWRLRWLGWASKRSLCLCVGLKQQHVVCWGAARSGVLFPPFQDNSGILCNANCLWDGKMNSHVEFKCKYQKKRDVHKISARNSGAGNGCADFMGAWHFLVLSAGKPPCP